MVALSALLSVAAGWRVVQAARAPRDVALRAVAAGLVCIWALYAVAAPGDAGTLAALAGDSAPEHWAVKLVQHLLVVVCGYALMCFYLFAAPTTRTRRRAGREGAVLFAVVAALTVIASSAPEGTLTRDYLGSDMTVPAVLGFYVLTAVYLAYLAAAAGWWTASYARISRRPYATGLWVAAGGMGASALASAAHAVAMVVRGFGRPAPWSPAAQFLLVAAVVTLVAGLSYPVVRLRAAEVPLWCRRLRMYRRLEPLWRLLTRTYPDLVFSPAARIRRGGGVHRRLHRRLIECRDGLVRISPYLNVPACRTPLEDLPSGVLAARLREACAARARVDAADDQYALPPYAPCGQNREDDLWQLLGLADALRTQGRT